MPKHEAQLKSGSGHLDPVVQSIVSSAKDSHIFSTKNNSVFVILMFEILTKR